ncbi:MULTISPECIES: class I SAM-dependent methyltransferase [unclassified Pseudomonas]|uniref:class I SAM-dependent methyltransferase n=1 Tax=unclassified Pseudomonas TaxID=196821 RepID=UPI000BD3F547|nr:MULTISPECIES: class I SAM-dependent methyltransferase [unclassified Pseudomonas]PVZ19839.1 23S rRNA (cytosine1962-C5)-methyltransferase [Pseudomonas sp. URIL14HWK12:I12]PVZ26905.1 23S rRNA (cytosine1962-C5)-methyltransferase [Pseudomonas sp. URIL14HWK12:I10]PVZ37794.1 23S rRNA (cytosine1962-C5)-methyltransferase [Pseudomonas sp. URIL14HWK12:I11]SNZ05642.1 23S rRNA (cytosine1962-C5)-methyltransferase [Pseudomonas sp. URIL14HWK12:I9]
MNHAVLDLFDALVSPQLADPPAETRRLLHGRGRRWPGLEQVSVDWLEGVLAISLFRAPSDLTAFSQRCLEIAARQPLVEAVLLQLRYLPGAPSQWLAGEPRPEAVVHEQGMRYQLSLGQAQNSGLFLDMRLGRQWVRENSNGARVLNLFAYTCAFSVCAIAGGAEAVVNLDMARGPLARGRENHRLNGHDLSRVSFLGHELFRSWGKLTRLGPYDLIIIDPPTFQKGSFVLGQDYERILRRLPTLLNPGGRVLACMNDPALHSHYLVQCMAEHAPQLRFVERIGNPREFADSDPEGGLKVLSFCLA